MRFDIRTVVDAQALSRVLEHFALRTLMPDRVEAARNSDVLDITLEIEGLDEPQAQLIVEKIRVSVLVLEAKLSPHLTQCLEGITS